MVNLMYLVCFFRHLVYDKGTAGISYQWMLRKERMLDVFPSRFLWLFEIIWSLRKTKTFIPSEDCHGWWEWVLTRNCAWSVAIPAGGFNPLYISPPPNTLGFFSLPPKNWGRNFTPKPCGQIFHTFQNGWQIKSPISHPALILCHLCDFQSSVLWIRNGSVPGSLPKRKGSSSNHKVVEEANSYYFREI